MSNPKTQAKPVDIRFIVMLYMSGTTLATSEVSTKEQPDVRREIMSAHVPTYGISQFVAQVISLSTKQFDFELVGATLEHFKNSQVGPDPDDPEMSFVAFSNCPKIEQDVVEREAFNKMSKAMSEEILGPMGDGPNVRVIKLDGNSLKDNPEFAAFSKDMQEAIEELLGTGKESVVTGPESASVDGAKVDDWMAGLDFEKAVEDDSDKGGTQDDSGLVKPGND